MIENMLPDVDNLLIQQLTHTQRSNLLSSCDQIDLQFGDKLYIPEQPYTHVYFPLTGVISLLTGEKGQLSMEVGMIGNEGMLGATLLLGVNTAPIHAIVQGSGSALRMSVRNFHTVLDGHGNLRPVLGRYIYVLMKQLSKTAACSHYHDVEMRLARWLLMIHDRVRADSFYLTHDFLADMLGVQRSAVTIAAGAIKNRQAIKYSRGLITILDRKKLEQISCRCYDGMLDDYRGELI
jgi:CRP-like cAMP-binding protein